MARDQAAQFTQSPFNTGSEYPLGKDPHAEEHRLIDIAGASIAKIVPPLELSGPVKHIWENVVNSLPAAWFYSVDGYVLLLFCEAVVEYKDMKVDLEIEGFTLVDDKGKTYSNPLAAMIRQTRVQILAMAAQLSFTPRSRSAQIHKNATGTSKAAAKVNMIAKKEKAIASSGRSGQLLAISSASYR